MTSILGISAFYHDSAACLVVDGEILAAVQEKRFTRIKHDHRFPMNAVRYCLKEWGGSAEQLEYVAFYDKPLLKFDRLLETYLDYAPRGFPSFLKAMPLWMKAKLWMPDLIRTELAKAAGIEAFARLFGGAPRRPESELTQIEMDLARSIQVIISRAS